ncbi:hypothetical protein ACFL6U_08590 [Planctomycetota bacterium]
MRKSLTLSLFLTLVVIMHASADTPNPDPQRFASQIEAFENWDQKNSLPNDFVLMLGSSSIRMWPSAESFPESKIVNRGFGGAHISDLIHYQDRICTSYPPARCIVFYCGDNDIAAGKTPKQVLRDFETFKQIVSAHGPQTKLIYIPIKPCPSRWHLWEESTQVNDAIQAAAKTAPLLQGVRI